MNNLKCSQCGFTNWANAENCRKCRASLAGSLPSPDNFRPKPLPVIQKPSFFQVLKNDALSFFAIIGPIAAWAVYIAITFFGVSFESRRSGTVVENADGDPFFLIAPIAITILGAGFLFWRVNSISKIFESGERVVGRITDVSFFKDRGRVEFSYNFQRQSFQAGSAIMRNSKTENYRSGGEVVLIVDAANPKRVLIQDLYA